MSPLTLISEEEAMLREMAREFARGEVAPRVATLKRPCELVSVTHGAHSG